jgi:sensor c-di-GMP phosphodiesterase-like protein
MLKLAFTGVRQRDLFHEVAVRLQQRNRWLAILVGVALAAIPTAGFYLWVEWFIDQQGRHRVDQVAKRSLTMADRRADLILQALADLERGGVNSCSPAAIEAMRVATFWTTPVKEFSIVDAAGRTLCTDLGLELGPRPVVSSNPLTADNTSVIEVLRIGGHAYSMIRIRRIEPGRATSLAALAPAELFLPLASVPTGSSGTALTLTTRDGHLLSMGGTPPQDVPNESRGFVATAASDRFNLVARASLSHEQLLADYGRLHTAATLASVAVGLIIVGLAFALPLRRRVDPIAELERAVDAGELAPYFQPIVDIRTGKLRGAEVLVRWRKPDGSLALPATFIPLLESSGLIIDVTRALMRRARDELGQAYGRRPWLRIGFNLAAAHFADEAIVRDVREIFGGSPIRFEQIMLELTERQPLENLTETRRIIAALQGLGVGIAIDDVGTGHGGLSYVLKLGIDSIKIDKMFVDAIGNDRNSATIIETMIELARNLRMEIIAEGVETFEQVVALRDLGIRFAQGYVFAPALPASSFLRLVDAIDPLPQAAASTKLDVTGGRNAAA